MASLHARGVPSENGDAVNSTLQKGLAFCANHSPIPVGKAGSGFVHSLHRQRDNRAARGPLHKDLCSGAKTAQMSLL
jgi:hypothetical protein